MYRLPLVHDRRLDRRTPVAAVELTEIDLGTVELALALVAIDPPPLYEREREEFAALASRFERVRDELRAASRPSPTEAA